MSEVELGEIRGAVPAQVAPCLRVFWRDERNRSALVAHAGRPAHPVGEPLGRVGQVVVDDRSTWLMSSPRAATLVATRTGVRMPRNASMVRSRTPWDRLPCSSALG